LNAACIYHAQAVVGMTIGLRRLNAYGVLLGTLLCLAPAARAAAPAQRLPSAYLVFPYVESTGYQDTRIELVNLSGDFQTLQCFFVNGESWLEIGFIVSLTPYQPLTWLASSGLFDQLSGTAAPPFFGVGELKCAVIAAHPELPFHNAIQGRATVFALDGGTVSYGAVGFQRLTEGDYTGVIDLNGSTYAQCPNRLRFHVVTDQPPRSSSQLILVPCSQDLLLQVPTTTAVQILVINEFETQFSASFSVTCFDRRTLGQITDTLNRGTAGTDTAQLVVRGVGAPVLGLVIDGVNLAGTFGLAGNQPSFDGGRSARVILP
jgi:hypothetical protein